MYGFGAFAKRPRNVNDAAATMTESRHQGAEYQIAGR
jgi:hypothetical protein